VVIVAMPTSFMAVGEYYRDFTQTSDEEVRELLGTPTTENTAAPADERR
jgi:predicted phosphoribosyltransferase